MYLYNGDYSNVLETVKLLEGKYQLYREGDTPYEDLFSGVAENSCEVILSVVCDKRVGEIYTSHGGNGIMLLKGITGEDPYRGVTSALGVRTSCLLSGIASVLVTRGTSPK